MSAGFDHVIVGVALSTVTVPFAVEESPDTEGFVACTVNTVELAGVEAVSVIVRVEVLDVSPAAKLIVLGLNEALAPVGKEVVRVSPALNAVPVAPFRTTVTEYVALPGVPKVSAPA